jgi:hypothetical protein
MSENKAVKPTTARRETQPTEKKGGYPAGNKTTTQLDPPPPSWVRPVADSKPSTENKPSADTK